MVEVKYIKRGGKLCGPYYYQSVRDSDGNVKKVYLGKVDSSGVIPQAGLKKLEDYRPKVQVANSAKFQFNFKTFGLILLFVFLFGFGYFFVSDFHFNSNNLTGSYIFNVNKMVSSSAVLEVDGVSSSIPIELVKIGEDWYYNITTLDLNLSAGNHTIRIIDNSVIVFEQSISVPYSNSGFGFGTQDFDTQDVTLITSCPYVINVSGDYRLLNSVQSTATCINITAPNVILNCRGFTITYLTSTLGYGIITNASNTTIKDCIINQTYLASGTEAFGIYAVANITSLNILNNTLNMQAGTSDAIRLSNRINDSFIQNNTIIFTGLLPGLTFNTAIALNGTAIRNITISNNNIDLSRDTSITEIGIIIQGDSNTVINNSINASGEFYLWLNNASNTNISNNYFYTNMSKGGFTDTFSVIGSNIPYSGSYIFSFNDTNLNNTLYNNQIYGFFLSKGNGSSFKHNTLNANTFFSKNAPAIEISNPISWNISNNIIHGVAGIIAPEGIKLYSNTPYSVSLINNVLSNFTTGIRLTNCTDSLINLGSISSSSYSLNVINCTGLNISNIYLTKDMFFNNSNITFLNVTLLNYSNYSGTFNTSYSIHYNLISINYSIQRDTTNNIFIYPNLLGVDSNNLPEFNVSANLTFAAPSGLNSPSILRNNNTCGGICTNYNYNSTTGVATSSVTYFSNYSVDNGPVITVISPSGEVYNADFIVNISVTDPVGVNASAVYYRWENSSTNSSWFRMSNLTSQYFNATFNISLVAAGSYTLRFNVSNNEGNARTDATTTFSNAFMSITSCSISLISNTTYKLLNSMQYTGGNCINITGSDVILDCQGYTIDYSDGYGIQINSSNTIIKNCFINASNNGGLGNPLSDVYVFSSNNITIINNTINMLNSQAGNQPAILLSTVSNSSIANNTITGGMTFSGVSNSSIANNTIILSGSTSILATFYSLDINLTNSSSNYLTNNQIISSAPFTFSGSYNSFGLRFYDNSNNNTINYLTANSNETFIYSYSSFNNIFSNISGIFVYYIVNSSMNITNSYSTSNMFFNNSNVTFVNVTLLNYSSSGFNRSYSIHYDSILINDSVQRNTTNNIFIYPNLLGVDSNNLPEFNVSANLTFSVPRNLNSPSFLRDNTNCFASICLNENYNSATGVATTNVPFFSNYSINTMPSITIISPTLGAYPSNFIVNISVTDSIGVNASAVYYRWENSSTNSSWFRMSNLSSQYFNATFNISLIADGVYTLRFNASNIERNANTDSTVIFGTTSVPLTDCYTILTPTTYVLQNSIQSAATCINVTVSNVVLDCSGYSINYSATESIKSYGVFVNSSNFTIKNCIIRDLLTLQGYPTNPGIYILSSSNNTIINNTINISNAIEGIVLSQVSNSTIANNTIISNTRDAIQLLSNSNSNSIMNNTITILFSGSGIYINSSSNSTISNNLMKIYGGHWRYLEENSGIYFSNSSNSNLLNNNDITTTQTLTSTIYLNNSNNNIINGLTANATGKGVSSLSSTGNIISNSTINAGNYAFYIISSSTINITNSYSSSNMFFNNSDMQEIMFLTLVTLVNVTLFNYSSSGFNKSYSIHYDLISVNNSVQRDTKNNIFIQPNLLGVNSNNLPEFNVSANLTLKLSTSLNSSDIYLLRDNVICNATVCLNKNYSSNTGIFNFDVTKFSNYSVDAQSPTITLFTCIGDSGNSVVHGGIITCLCSATDDSLIVPTLNYEVHPSTTYVGTFTTTCQAMDWMGRNSTASTTYVSTQDVNNGGQSSTPSPSPPATVSVENVATTTEATGLSASVGGNAVTISFPEAILKFDFETSDGVQKPRLDLSFDINAVVKHPFVAMKFIPGYIYLTAIIMFFCILMIGMFTMGKLTIEL